jgi:GTP cyclohydrolase I
MERRQSGSLRLIETPARVTRGFEEASVGLMAAQVANTVNEVLEPLCVGLVIKASRHCMVARVHNRTQISSQVVCSAACATTLSFARNF